jgi:hypothetical protein
MTAVAISGEQLHQQGEINQALNQLQILVDDLKRKAEQYPFSKDQLAVDALEAKVAASRIYKIALAA